MVVGSNPATPTKFQFEKAACTLEVAAVFFCSLICCVSHGLTDMAHGPAKHHKPRCKDGLATRPGALMMNVDRHLAPGLLTL